LGESAGRAERDRIENLMAEMDAGVFGSRPRKAEEGWHASARALDRMDAAPASVRGTPDQPMFRLIAVHDHVIA